LNWRRNAIAVHGNAERTGDDQRDAAQLWPPELLIQKDIGEQKRENRRKLKQWRHRRCFLGLDGAQDRTASLPCRVCPIASSPPWPAEAGKSTSGSKNQIYRKGKHTHDRGENHQDRGVAVMEIFVDEIFVDVGGDAQDSGPRTAKSSQRMSGDHPRQTAAAGHC
jgi:hypothetical protein